jgi:NAD(P)-dependent dehydrogenase (short-subunit alcohol dehydrogenase family)
MWDPVDWLFRIYGSIPFEQPFDCSKILARQGYHVYASMRQVNGKNAPFAEELRDFATANHCKLESIELDVTDEASVNGAVAQIVAQAGKIDVLVNNAGIWGPGVLEAFSMDDWKEIFEVNLLGSVRAARAVLPYMRGAGSGLIVQISSLQGRFILPYSGPTWPASSPWRRPWKPSATSRLPTG